MATIFIADLHLSEQEPAITAGFLRFLEEDAPHAEALYILGDLFETWIGDDDPEPLHDIVANALFNLHQKGVPCYFIHGNRDFLVGKAFAKRSGMHLLPHYFLLDLYGTKTLIAHGDTFCIDDIGYQRFRRIVHNPIIQWLFLAMPLKTRLKIAAKLRNRSRMTNEMKSISLMDVNQQAVIESMAYFHTTLLIHGHTHRPAIHELMVQNHPARRAVLGAWHETGSVLKVTADNLELIEFPLPIVTN